MACLFSLKWSILFFFEKRNSKRPTQDNSQYFFMTFLWFGPWVSRIDLCEGHWCGSTYMVVRLSDISSKTGKICVFVFLGCFWAYVGQPHNHTNASWSLPMPFASINYTKPIHEHFMKKYWGLTQLENEVFLRRPFFFAYLSEKSSPFIWGIIFSALWMVFTEFWKRSCPNFHAHDCSYR